MTIATAPRTGTDAASEQKQLTACAWTGCHALFSPRFPGQKFHSPKCKAAYAREVGLVATLKHSRRLKRGRSFIVHTGDDDRDPPLGTRFLLVRLPD